MKLVLSTGFADLGNYWGNWFTATQIGGSEHIVLSLAQEFVKLGHQVTLRVPFVPDRREWCGASVVGLDSAPIHGDASFCFDQYDNFDPTDKRVLVAFRSDPPRHTDFDQEIYLSQHHANFCGRPGRPHVGGGVSLADYAGESKRTKGLVLCTSSPDRCQAAFAIGAAFPRFVFTYKPVPGLPPTRQVSRPELVKLQRSAQVLIYPLDPRRPSDFFSMAVLEAMAAGTPVVVSDADSMPELWSAAAVVLPRPVRLAQWVETVEEILGDPRRWKSLSGAGRACARAYAWDVVAQKYLTAAGC